MACQNFCLPLCSGVGKIEFHSLCSRSTWALWQIFSLLAPMVPELWPVKIFVVHCAVQWYSYCLSKILSPTVQKGRQHWISYSIQESNLSTLANFQPPSTNSSRVMGSWNFLKFEFPAIFKIHMVMWPCTDLSEKNKKCRKILNWGFRLKFTTTDWSTKNDPIPFRTWARFARSRIM